ncbi:MAG: hypothetical protein LBT62_01135 [Deltaproteobacteria bacterium]|nr:hypothetical protein [Deltaproteobacteria bacterium]
MRELTGRGCMMPTLRYAHLAPKVKMRAVESLDEGTEDHAMEKTFLSNRQSV